MNKMYITTVPDSKEQIVTILGVGSASINFGENGEVTSKIIDPAGDKEIIIKYPQADTINFSMYQDIYLSLGLNNVELIINT